MGKGWNRKDSHKCIPSRGRWRVGVELYPGISAILARVKNNVHIGDVNNIVVYSFQGKSWDLGTYKDLICCTSRAVPRFPIGESLNEYALMWGASPGSTSDYASFALLSLSVQHIFRNTNIPVARARAREREKIPATHPRVLYYYIVNPWISWNKP